MFGWLAAAQAKRLEELEKLYKDEQVRRRRLALATHLASQVSNLATCSSLFTCCPQVTRKRYFNMMEDMKGKIRVFCRVRPMLTFESDKGQVRSRGPAAHGMPGAARLFPVPPPARPVPPRVRDHPPHKPPRQPTALASQQVAALLMPDELTVAHAWRDEKKPREYNFDTVRRSAAAAAPEPWGPGREARSLGPRVRRLTCGPAPVLGLAARPPSAGLPARHQPGPGVRGHQAPGAVRGGRI